MKKLLFCIILFCTINIAAKAQTPEFDTVLMQITDTLVKKKLQAFCLAGIEKPLPTENITADSLIITAQKYLKLSHCMGGNGKTSKNRRGKPCIDCSGLLYAVFNDLGINPYVRSSQEMARFGKIITRPDELQKGDMIFFVKSYRPRSKNIVITHSGFMVDSKSFIHASASQGVIISNLDEKYWNTKYVFGTRILAK